MAVYRQIHTSFWQDPFVLELTPEEKYFYLYLMTNTKTTQIGIYEIPKQIIVMETGFDIETVQELIDTFVNYKKIIYSEETNEMMLLNWIKYNGSSSPKILARVKAELREVKNKELVKKYIDISQRYGYDILSTLSTDDSLYIEYQYSMDTKSQKEKEKEKEKEREKEKEENSCSSNSTYPKDENLILIVREFEANGFGTINANVKEMLLALLDEYSKEWILEAFKIAVKNNKRTLGYVEGILQNWKTQGGMKTENKKNVTYKKTRFHNFKQRTDDYTAEELEDIAARKRRQYLEKMKEEKEETNEDD